MVLYLLTGILFAVRLFARKDADPKSLLRNKNGLIVLGLVAVMLHSIVLYNGLFVTNGLNLGFFNAGSLILWLIALTVLLGALANPVENLALLSIAAAHAIVLSIQDRHLRNRKPGGFIRALPPLETMENLLFQMIAIGFFLHSLSLITGMIYLDDMFAQHLAHKTILSIIAWFVFAILLWGRWRFGWRGRIAIRWTLTGFVFLLLAYMGSKWVLEIVLAR